MKLPMFVADAFTTEDGAFTGNPAAVCLLDFDDDITDEKKQKIASQMNLSETAYVSHGWTREQRLPDNTLLLRWFTPATEVPLCGHATLASAHILFEKMLQEKGQIEAKEIVFRTRYFGDLPVGIELPGRTLTLNFPENRPQELRKSDCPWLGQLIGAVLGDKLTADDVMEVLISPKVKKLLVRLKDSPEDKRLLTVTPDFVGMRNVDSGGQVMGVIVTEKADFNRRQVHFYSRYFAPCVGIDEDPFTGSAHTVLVPYWASHYQKSDNLIGLQCSARRGLVKCRLAEGRVFLTGTGRTVLRGEFVV